MIIHYENDTSYDKLFLYTDLFVKVFQTFCVCVCVCALQVTRSLLDDFYFYLIKTLRELCDEPMAVFPNITRTFDNCAPPIMTTTIYRGSIILTYTHYILLGYHGFVLIFKRWP